MMPPRTPSYVERTRWFHQARFGMFIHYGLYSLLERGEWVMYQERIPADSYATLAERFRPKKNAIRDWIKLAVEAGARYVCLTTRHHEGFSLFDSKVSAFTSVRTAARRDLVAEFVTEARKARLRIGLYYSLLDWRFTGCFDPRRQNVSAGNMVRQAHEQVRELLTNYGKIDVLWYDGGWVPAFTGQIPYKKWLNVTARFWRAQELNAMARALQPHILINGRSGRQEDLETPEQQVLAAKAGRAWETCMTIGDPCGWGYIRHNPTLKTVPQLIQHLVNTAAGEGNLLLNIGPRSDGSVRREETERLRAIGKWLKINGEAIYGCRRCHLYGGTSPVFQHDWNMLGRWTARGNVGYLHVFRWPGSEAVIPLVAPRALRATLLATGQALSLRRQVNGRLVITGLPKDPPDPSACVIKIQFGGQPAFLKERSPWAWLNGKA